MHSACVFATPFSFFHPLSVCPFCLEKFMTTHALGSACVFPTPLLSLFHPLSVCLFCHQKSVGTRALGLLVSYSSFQSFSPHFCLPLLPVEVCEYSLLLALVIRQFHDVVVSMNVSYRSACVFVKQHMFCDFIVLLILLFLF